MRVIATTATPTPSIPKVRGPDMTDEQPIKTTCMWKMDYDPHLHRPTVYLIWKRFMGVADIDKMQLVCICSTQELLNRRMDAMRDWAKGQDAPWRFWSEAAWIDHLFGGVEQKAVDMEDGTFQRLLNDNMRMADHVETQIEEFKERCRVSMTRHHEESAAKEAAANAEAAKWKEQCKALEDAVWAFCEAIGMDTDPYDGRNYDPLVMLAGLAARHGNLVEKLNRGNETTAEEAPVV